MTCFDDTEKQIERERKKSSQYHARTCLLVISIKCSTLRVEYEILQSVILHMRAWQGNNIYCYSSSDGSLWLKKRKQKYPAEVESHEFV